MAKKRKNKSPGQLLAEKIIERIAGDPDFRAALIASPDQAVRDAGFSDELDELERSNVPSDSSGCDVGCSKTCGYKSCGERSCLRSCNGNSVRTSLVVETQLLAFLLTVSNFERE